MDAFEYLTFFGLIPKWVMAIGAAMAVFVVMPGMMRQLGNEGSRLRSLNWLKGGSFKRHYVDSLCFVLDWIDSKVSREIVAAEPEKTTSLRRAWTVDLLELNLSLAVIYPALLVLMQWGLTGNAISLGSIEILPEDGRDFQRLAMVGAALVGVAFLIAARMKPGFDDSLSPGHVRKELGEPERRGRRLLPVGIVIVAAVIIWAAIETPVVTLLIVAVVFATLVSGSAAIGVALIIAAGANIPLAFLVVAGWVGYSVIRNRVAPRNRYLAGLGFVAFLYVIQIVLAASIPRDDIQTKLFMMVGFLPIVNGLLDFFSFGFTRHRLRVALKNDSFLLQAVIDAVASIVSFFLLAALVILSYSLIRDGNGEQVFDIEAIFSALRDNASAYYWLIFVFASTLVPTALHIYLCLSTVLITQIPMLERWTIRAVEACSDEGYFWITPGVAALMSVFCYFLIIIPLTILHYAWSLSGSLGVDLGRYALWGLAELAKALGVLDASWTL